MWIRRCVCRARLPPARDGGRPSVAEDGFHISRQEAAEVVTYPSISRERPADALRDRRSPRPIDLELMTIAASITGARSPPGLRCRMRSHARSSLAFSAASAVS
jgi:hypothetical protein